MIIYHGSPSPASIESCREAAASHTHGAEWSTAKMTPHDWPYILDNGAFPAYLDGVPWDADAFVGRLSQLDTMPRDPDFVVLPDVVTDPSSTKERACKWAGVINWPTAYPVQDGIDPEEGVELCDRTDSKTIFVGGTVEWKRRNAEAFIAAAHDHALDCHIGRPGDLVWAERIGADSVDTTSIVRNKSWHRLKRLEASNRQQTITRDYTTG